MTPFPAYLHLLGAGLIGGFARLEGGKRIAVCVQLGVGADLHDAARIRGDDLADVAHGADVASDLDDDTIPRSADDVFTHARLGGRVDLVRGLVEGVDRGVSQECAGQGQALMLTA